MKKLLSKMWKLPLPALLAIYAATYAFASFRNYRLVSGSYLTQMVSEFASMGVDLGGGYTVAVFIFSVLFALLFNYVLIRLWYAIFVRIYVRTFTKGRAALIKVRLPFTPAQFSTLIFMMLIFFNVLLGLFRLALLANVSYYLPIEYIIKPLCVFAVGAFGCFIFNRYILPVSVAYNATLALMIPFLIIVLYL